MERYQELIGRQILAVLTLLIAVAVSLSVPTELNAQTKKGLQMKTAGADTSEVSATAGEGMPERGRFQFWYSYSGESIDATIQVSKNGTVIGEQSGLSPVTDVLLADAKIEQGDVIVVSSHFKDSHNSGAFGSENVFGHSAGLWYSFGNGAFYALDQDGNIIEVFGTWDFNLTLTPPWNGIEVTADPESISPGDSSSISLQPYETPSEPVIIPDQTYINLQTSLLGDLIGGLGLPEYGIRYTQGFVNAPWGLLRDTDILYEVHPSIEASDDFEIPVVAYSPYDTGINGSTAIEVKKEEELEIILDISGSNQAWPAPRNKSTTVDKKIENIVVTVTKFNGDPAPNKPVEIEAVWVKGSGGHDHTDNKIPPKNKMGVLSVLLDSPLAPKEGKGIVSAKTDGDGKIYLNYTNPKFGGKINLVATLQTDTKGSDSKQVISRVPKLKELGSSQYYELVGAPDNHRGTNDPCRWPPGSEHFSNHWGDTTLTKAIKEVAVDFDSLYTGTQLRINDMSLENGGLFDFENNWSKPHKSHRTGTNADIGFKAVGPDGECKEDINLRDLRQRIYITTQKEPYVESNHYHIYSK